MSQLAEAPRVDLHWIREHTRLGELATRWEGRGRPESLLLRGQLAGLVGGLGMAPGANIGPDAAIFEAVHGSAPDIAGKGIANPLALLLAVGLMLEHIDQPDLANRLRTAIDQVLRKDGVRTPDLGGKASTGDFTQSIIRRLG